MRESEQKSVAEHLFSQHEESFEHASYDRELAFYESICSGNMELVRVFMKPLFCDGCGVLSEDSLRNLKYHLVILAAIIARYCIKGGMTPEESYGLSDFYILKTDKCSTEKELRAVHLEMIEGYTNKMRQIKLNGVYSKQIVHAVNYIICRLHSRVTLEQTAAHLKISSAYLSRLFKKETGKTFISFLTDYRMEKAVELLMTTNDKTYIIAEKVGYADPNYFSYAFKKQYSMSPSKYRSANSNG